jgi:hypothetical protein
MRSFRPLAVVPLALFCILGTAAAQRHDLGSSPPTAPPPKPVVTAQTIVPTGPDLGALQFSTVDYAVSAPESLVIQMQSSDDRTRTAALAAIGAPAEYLNPGRVPFPHSVRLDFFPLGDTKQLDAILTVELDQHLVSAILMPIDDEWHRIATVLYPTPFRDPSITPSTFLRADRDLLEPQRYTAIFHTTTPGTNGDFTENEVHLRILDGHAAITTSFASTERVCDPTAQHPCEITQRWLQPDTTDPEHRFLLVTATGHVKPNDPTDPIVHAETFETAHLRTFTCQPFAFSDTDLHFEPTANPTPCAAPHDSPNEPQHDPQHQQPLH